MASNTASGFSAQKLLPLIIIAIVAVIGFFTLRDYLSFDALRDNREALLAWRDVKNLTRAQAPSDGDQA